MFVTISLAGNRQFISSLRREKQASKKTALKYIVLGDVSSEVIQEIGRLGFHEVDHIKHEESNREEFLHEYIDLIGLIGKEQGNREWWATHIASKNRFISRIPHLLQQFLLAMETILRRDYDQLVILKPSWVIVDSLKKALEAQGIDYLCIEDRYGKWREIVAGWSLSILSALYNGFIMFIRSMYVRIKLKDIIRKGLNTSKACYVIKTFIYDHSFSEDGDYHDAFFGTLPEFLKRGNQVVIFANILGAYRICLERIKKCSSPTILPLEAFLSGRDIIAAFIRLLFYRIRIKKQTFFYGFNVSDLINNELTRTHHGISFEQYLHYWMTMRLLQAVHVETFLLTYENNPWEKMCIMAVREGAPGIIVGYQHNVVPQASANMFVSRWEKNAMPMPDRILTVGDRPKEIMERYGNYDCGEIETSCGLRFEYLENLPVAARQRLGNILVVLEGIDDVYKMVNYVMKELGRNESFKVIIRTHPVLPFHCIQRKLDYSLDSLPNFGLSTRNSSLKDDIEWADVVMYWGTTVALEALCMGKPLIHYSIGTCLSYDPLFECWHLKWTVSDEESMVNILDEIYSLDDAEFYVEQNHALAYIRHYVFPVSEHGLSRFFVHDLLWAKSSQLN